MRRCILATVCDVITDHVVWLLWWMPDVHPLEKRSRFAHPATSRELEQSSKGFLLKSTEKRPMGYVGIWVQNKAMWAYGYKTQMLV